MLIYGKRIICAKKKYLLIFILTASTFFLIYQLIFMNRLVDSVSMTTVNKGNLIVKTNAPEQYIIINAQGSKDILHIFDDRGLVRGIRLSDLQKYKPNDQGKFVCFKSKLEIDISMVNDDYCDCPEDGSDEPGTNACDNGTFYCSHQPKYLKHKPLFIPSSRVNDGICDCCDGSDEWNHLSPLKPLPLSLQKKLGRYQAPCPNTCLTKA